MAAIIENIRIDKKFWFRLLSVYRVVFHQKISEKHALVHAILMFKEINGFFSILVPRQK